MQFFSHLFVFGALIVLCLADKEVDILRQTLRKCGGKEKTSSLLDFSKELIKSAKDLYPNCTEDGQNCGNKEKSSAILDVAINVISEVEKGYPTCPDPECPEYVERPMDCSDILRSGKKESGVYTIWPRSRSSTNKSLAVYCDMETAGGGWTVIQRRGNFSNPTDYFYKDWESYKDGFGNLTEEFWIGNDNIYDITNQAFLNKPYTIRFDMEDVSGNSHYAEYSVFWIEDEAANYTLHIEGYTGNAGDSMAVHNTMKFSTKGRKNDIWGSGSCAEYRKGAWWYAKCADSNLNGLYLPGEDSNKSCHWYSVKDNSEGLAKAEMKVRS